jgi:ABC-type dipeptide/oligopeptide/nickel transport system permease component
MMFTLLKRALRVIVLLFGITFLSFALSFFSPGDPVQIMLNSSGGRVSEEPVIFFRNILKNCAAPLISLLSMSFGSMLGGAAIVESMLASIICDRIAVMKDGKLIEMGDADRIIDSPNEEYTRKLVSALMG